MKLTLRSAAIALTAAIAASSAHAANSHESVSMHPAAGFEVWSSTDSDKTSVVKLLGRALWEFEGPSKFRGIDLELARFAPQGQHARTQTRAYVDLADTLKSKWKWAARVGTDGHTVLGSASMHSDDWSKEFFVEREIVETPRGVDERLYYTFAGTSLNLISTERDTISAMGGFQKFTGRNERYHLRSTLVHVVKRNLGLSVQLRARYFHSTVPGEFDYYSPKDFVQLIPVVQMRRFTHAGWMYLIAVGWGGQKATSSHWQSARLADVRLESPASTRQLHAFAQVQYSNNSLAGAASSYSYVVARAGFSTTF